MRVLLSRVFRRTALRHMAPNGWAWMHPRGVSSRISVVDLAPADGSAEGNMKVAKALSDAFADTGFAIVTSTGVPTKVITELRSASVEFFHLSVEEKQLANEGVSLGYGHSPYCRMEENGAQLLGDFTKPNDLVESLTYRPQEGLKLPQNPRLQAAVQDFMTYLPEFQKVLCSTCELALGLEAGFFAARQTNNESLRMAFYPDLGDSTSPLEGQMRCGAHVDSFGITILNLDPQHPEGLQVRLGDSDDSEWADVPYVEGSFVLNVGALLSRWTNGFWKASVHRVLFMPGQRLSIVAGALRPWDDVLIEACGPAADEKRFSPIVAGDFCKERVELHRPSYLQQKGMDGHTEDLSDAIRNYQQ